MKAYFLKVVGKITNISNLLLERLKELLRIDLLSRYAADVMDKVRNSEAYQKVHGAYMDLEDKDKKIVNVILIVVGCFMLLLLILPFTSHLSDYNSRISKANKALDEIEKVGATYQESKSAILALKRNFKTDPNFKAAPFVEKIASEVGIQKIESFNAKAPTKKEYIVINKYVVKLAKIHLRNVVDFIYKVENSGMPFFVTSLKLTRLYSNIKYFNVDLVLSYKEFNKEGKNEK